MNQPAKWMRSPLSRRRMLHGTGAALLSLPLLEAMQPHRASGSTRGSLAPKRFVAACATLGFHGPHLFPEKAGSDYELSPYLKRLEPYRQDFTVFSGMSHPDQQGNNGHASEMTWLTGAVRPGLAGFRNTISLDQWIAERIGIETRFPFLALSTSGRSMSWTSSGVEIPGEMSIPKLFKSLFIDGTEREVQAEMRQLERGRSILDTVQSDAKRLEREVSRNDQRKLDEYLTAVRDLEYRIQQSQGWVTKAKPKVDRELPKEISDRNDAIGKQRMMFDMIVLALQTDSTRTITFQISGMNAVPTIPGVKNDWHNLSHHGKDPAKIDELRVIEEAEFEVFGEFLGKLKQVQEEGVSLLDHTAVLYGSNLGNASSHDWHNLPTIVAGGGFQHGQHLAFDQDRNLPLSNLFVALTQNMGLEMEKFGTSNASSVPGLKTA